MLERAEQRSKALGITNKAKIPLTEYNQEPITPHKTVTSTTTKKTPSPTKRTTINKDTQQSPSPSSSSLAKKQIHRSGSIHVSSTTKESKENVDLAVEINITTGPNVQVIIFASIICINSIQTFIFLDTGGS